MSKDIYTLNQDGEVVFDAGFLHEEASLNVDEPVDAPCCKQCGDVMPVRTTNGFCRFCERVTVLKAVIRREAYRNRARLTAFRFW